jgi:DNA mismatch repair protein MSH6
MSKSRKNQKFQYPAVTSFFSKAEPLSLKSLLSPEELNKKKAIVSEREQLSEKKNDNIKRIEISEKLKSKKKIQYDDEEEMESSLKRPRTESKRNLRPVYSPSPISPAKFPSSEVNIERFPFLLHRLDGMKRPENDPNFDPTTLYISSQQLQALTPFERQYWLLKKDRMDMILFVQKGRFYDVFEEDADIAVKELDLKLVNKINMRSTGVPEIRFSEWIKKLIRLSFIFIFPFVISDDVLEKAIKWGE